MNDTMDAQTEVVEALRKVLEMVEGMQLCFEFVAPNKHDDFLDACDDARRALNKHAGRVS